MSNLNLSVSQVASEHLCNSCGACFAICNKGAIQYTETVGGYLFPKIAPGSCSNCGLCYQICPGIHFGRTLQEQMPQDPFVGHIISCHVGRAVESKMFINSQSGGVAIALLKNLFETDQIDAAIVAVMRSSTPPRGDVFVAYNVGELLQAQKSKYTPIPMLKAFKQTGDLPGRIAIVGLPCHIHGLQNMIDILPVLREKVVYKVGLICDRVMTIAAIDFFGKKATSGTICNFVFRDKSKPSYPGNPVVTTTGGERITLSSALRTVMKDFFTPVRCRLCFDKLNVFSDVVLGDPHGVAGVDRFNGETLLMVRTDLGRELVAEASLAGVVKLRGTVIEQAVNGQGIKKKRIDWAGYMKAWGDMNRQQPQYPFAFSSISNYGKKKQWLLHGLKLDQFPSRAAVIKAANSWFLKQRIRRLIYFPFKKINGVLRSRQTVGGE